MCSTGSHENSSGPPTQILESSLDWRESRISRTMYSSWPCMAIGGGEGVVHCGKGFVMKSFRREMWNMGISQRVLAAAIKRLPS